MSSLAAGRQEGADHGSAAEIAALGPPSHERLEPVLRDLDRLGGRVGPAVELHAAGEPRVAPLESARGALRLKRAVDVVVASFGLVLAAPLFLAIAFGV